jgi:hypothetical protein
MANSRNKGAAFERSIANELHLLTGVSFKRDLEQYRAADHGDLIPDDADWPFVIECKAYAHGKTCRPAWKQQATKAAVAAGKMPCVVYKYDRVPVRVAVPWFAMTKALGVAPGPDDWFECSLEGLAFLAGEIMAGKAV